MNFSRAQLRIVLRLTLLRQAMLNARRIPLARGNLQMGYPPIKSRLC